MCKILQVSRSGYYAWLKRKPSARTLENQELVKHVREIYHKSKQRYGSPKITMALRARGYLISRPRVARLMKANKLKSIVHKKYQVKTTDSNHGYPVKADLVERNFHATTPSQIWVSDITYIPTQQGWLYVTVIMDLYDRKIIGWSLSTNMTAKDTVCRAWQMARTNRSISSSLIFHSDRGVQYACKEFSSQLKASNIRQSMSRKGDCWDNAVAENFFKILKSELGKKRSFQTLRDAKTEVFEFIEIWYNRNRMHSRLGYLTPESFGNNLLEKAA